MLVLPRRARAFAALGTAAAAVAFLIAPLPAVADTAPGNSSTPTTVASDALPTVQVDGVVWTQVVIGNTVYAGGSFQNAYPAGAAKGTNLTPRANLLAYNLKTGALITTFAPTFNAQVRTLAASPDGSTLYVGGDFTQVSGTAESHTVALNPTTGSIITSFKAKASSAVYGLAATASTLYIGGGFTTMNGVQVQRVAAVNAATGAVNASWLPQIPSGVVHAIVVSPDGTKVVLGGNFPSVDGSTSPGEGLGMVDSTTGTTELPFAVGGVVQDYGTNASILSLWTDGTNVYGTGYVFGSPGNFEGAFEASWNGGAINWLEDCHGDSYGVATLGSAVYVVSHAHFCGDVPGGFDQTNANPSLAVHQHALAYSVNATGTLATNPYPAYANFAGQPAPSLLAWYPTLAIGSITGQYQAAWSITTSSQGYVLLGGEFPSVNGTAQAGLVRFAVSSIAPDKDGPRQSGSSWVPTVTSTDAGQLRVSVVTNWDRDNANLTYKLYRDGGSTPVYTTTATSNDFWNRPALTYVDTGLAVGSTHSYRWTATDPFGNTASSQTVSGTVGSVAASAYAKSVIVSKRLYTYTYRASNIFYYTS